MPMGKNQLAELIWKLDGPTYRGWPNIGERVYWDYRDQYPRHRDRCIMLAEAILAAIGNSSSTPEKK